VVLPLAALALAGCSLRFDAFTCTSDSSCGANHACIESACATLDHTCTSGSRWDGTAGSRQGQCTPSGPLDAGGFDLAGDASAAPRDLASYDLGVACGVNAFCEDFESGSLDPWVQSTSSATEGVDTTKAQHGSHALHVTTSSWTSGPTLYPSAVLGTKMPYLFTDGATDAWVRFFIYVKSPLPTEFTTFFELQQAIQMPSPLQLCLTGGTDPKIRMNNYLASPEQATDTTGTLTPDAWTCVVYHVHGASPGLVELAIDDTPLPQQLAGSTMWSPEPGIFQLAWFGQADSNDPAAHEIWYDNVVLASRPLDCSF
jgi:hypothetical protein